MTSSSKEEIIIVKSKRRDRQTDGQNDSGQKMVRKTHLSFQIYKINTTIHVRIFIMPKQMLRPCADVEVSD